MKIIIAVLLLAGCAVFRETPPTSGKFMDTNYTEIKADPGRVLDERLKLNEKYGPTRGTELGKTLCGFVDFYKKIVWIARSAFCPEDTKEHERCHVLAHESGSPDNCHDGRFSSTMDH